MPKIWLPGSYEDIFDNAQLLYRQGDFEGAAGEYRRLVERISKLKPELLNRRPSLVELLLLSGIELGNLLRRMERHDEAIAWSDNLIESFPAGNNLWRRIKALNLIAKGEVAAGLDELRSLVIEYSHQADNWRTLGTQCLWTGNYDEAEENLLRAIEKGNNDDADSMTYWMLFELYRETGRNDEALAAWEDLAAFEGFDDFWGPPCHLLLQMGDLERAEQYIEREENELRRGLLRGLLTQAQGEEEQAQQHWQHVYDADPDDYEDGLDAWAEAALRLGQPEDALDVLSENLEDGENMPRWYLLLAIAEANYGHADHAGERLENAIALSRLISHRSRLSTSDWHLFDELVDDADFKEQARSFFAQEGDELPGYNTF